MASEGVGYICCLIAVLFFGSNFVPVKRFETYDGMFYQWVMCSAIWCFGLLVQLVMMSSEDVYEPYNSSNPHHLGPVAPIGPASRTDDWSVKFFPFAAFGGALWATGNIMSVPCINSIGLSMGLLIWGAANMLMGWATGAFGLFGTGKDEGINKALNYTGVAIAVVALGIYTQVKASTGKSSQAIDVEDGILPLRAGSSTKPVGDDLRNVASEDISAALPETVVVEHEQTAGLPRPIGILMAIVSGILYGNNFTPPQHMEHQGTGPDGDHPLTYVFSHFTGIFAMSTFWFIAYCAYTRSNPRINPRLVLPGFVSGIMWAIANTSWFVANNSLSMSVAFPIITSGPGIVSALWGVFVFGEIRGQRNMTMLSVSIFLSVTGCILIALSKS